MTQQLLIDGESGLNSRTKINENFTELYEGAAVLRNNIALKSRNVADDGDVQLIKLNASDKVEIDPDGAGSVFGGDVSLPAGNLGVGTGNTVGGSLLVDITGASGVANFSNQVAGTIAFGDIGTNAPGVIGKTAEDNQGGLQLFALTRDTNSQSDMTFAIRKNDGSDYSTLTTGAFRWARFATTLMALKRDGGLSLPNMKSGINQGAAGAAAGELWFDTSAGNVVTMGV